MYREWKKRDFPKKVLSMNFKKSRLRSRPRNRWKDQVTKDGIPVGGTGWRKRVHNREEWKKLLRTARNRSILHIPMNERAEIRGF